MKAVLASIVVAGILAVFSLSSAHAQVLAAWSDAERFWEEQSANGE